MIWACRALLLVGVICLVIFDETNARSWAAVGTILALIGLEANHAADTGRLEAQVMKWHARWREEHDNFQSWIRGQIDRSRN